MKRSVWAWAVLALAVGAARGGEPVTKNPAARLTNPLAVRMTCYGRFPNAGWEHLKTLGVRHVFLPAPAPNEVQALRERLARHGLTALVLGGRLDLAKDPECRELEPQLAACAALGVKHLFLSPRHEGVAYEEACRRLRAGGERARRHGVTLVLETHPDLGTNADVQRETMRRVDHPNVRINFDTGNITYYNRGADAVAELKKVADFVATVELKEHDGKFHSWFFPALGRGKVDFPALFQVLREHHFTGPLTLELEGVEGVTLDEAAAKKEVADSVDYLRPLLEMPRPDGSPRP